MTLRKIRVALRTFLYHLLVQLRLPLYWQASLLPKQLFSTQVCNVALKRIRLYSESDPSPPKRSARFCFQTSEEKKMLPLTSAFDEMTDGNPRSCVHNTVRAIFTKGIHYTETSQYERMLKSIDAGITPYHCHSKQDIDRYFERLNQAYNSIQSAGYKSQLELGKSSTDEIRIHITEDEALCLGSKGNHRFRMAELLGVEVVPCNVYGVNINWLIKLARRLKLPPHTAFLKWMKDQ